MKFKNTNEIIELMSENNAEAIIFGAKSDLPVLNLNAVIFCAKYNVKLENFIFMLKNSFINSDITFFGMPFSKIAIAALDVLGVEKYSGDDSLVKQLIDSKFNI